MKIMTLRTARCAGLYWLLRGRGPSSLKAGPRVHIHVVMQVGAPEVEVLTTDISFSLFIFSLFLRICLEAMWFIWRTWDVCPCA